MPKFVRGMPWYFALLLLRGEALKNLRQLKQWQWLNYEQTLALQHEQLAHLLRHSYQHVPYYHQVLGGAGVVNASGNVHLERFTQIPALEKATLRARFEELKSDDLHRRKWFYNYSGGSTGEPVQVIQDRYFGNWFNAAMILEDLWSGHSIGEETKVLLWGSERDLFVGRETLKVQLLRWIMNEIWLNAFRMTTEQMQAYVKQINVIQPNLIVAYANSIYELSRFIEREGLRIYSPRAIKTGAGTLYPHMREAIERVFKAPVFNRYGSRETPAIACECERHKGLHVFAPVHDVEILRLDGSPAKPGEVGEIVITSLTNYAMPLIRYRIGDMGAWAEEPCTCGRGWPLLKEVRGRVTDVFLKRDGGIVLPEYLIHIVGVVLNTGWIQKYQVIQEDYDLIRVLIVPREQVRNPQEYYAQEMRAIVEKICLVMSQDCQVVFEFVNDMAPTASGKHRYTISKVYRR